MLTSTQNKRDDIQGVRALAVLSVIIFHVDKDWMPGGFVGVDIFLVVSGFLITSIILGKKERGGFSYIQFYTSRVKRIVPAYVLFLSVVAIIMATLLTPQDFKFFYESLKSALMFDSNRYFAEFGDYFAPSVDELPLLHTWSLAVEMQFYLFLPLLVMVLPVKYLKIVIPCVIAALLVYSNYQITANDARQSVYYSLYARVPEFLMGAWLAVVPVGSSWGRKTSNIIGSLGLVLIVGSVFLITSDLTFPGYWAIPPCLGVMMILAANNGLANRVLSTSWLVWIGGLSYSLYLWHWPVLSGLRYYNGSYNLNTDQLIYFSVFTLLVSYLSFRWVEIPCRKKYPSKAPYLAISAVLVFSVTIGFLSTTLNSSIVKPLPKIYTQVSPKDNCHGKIIGDCTRGDKESDARLLLIGDSHAAHLNHFFDVVGKKNNQAVKIITASGCVTIPQENVNYLPKWARQPCLNQIEEAYAATDDVDTVVISGQWVNQVRRRAVRDGLERFLTDMKARNKSVIILAQTPMIATNVLRAHRFDQLSIPVDVTLKPNWDKGNYVIEEIVSRHENATYLDFSRIPLFANPPLFEGELLYRDRSHLNEVGSKLYGKYAAEYFKGLGDNS